jgi:hypothetical protein
MHGGPSTAASKGNNAFRHGRYSAEAVDRRREIAALIRRAHAVEEI